MLRTPYFRRPPGAFRPSPTERLGLDAQPGVRRGILVEPPETAVFVASEPTIDEVKFFVRRKPTTNLDAPPIIVPYFREVVVLQRGDLRLNFGHVSTLDLGPCGR